MRQCISKLIRSLTTGVPWRDKDHLLLEQSFGLLVDFFEQEKPFDIIDVENSQHKDEWYQLKGLYDWWVNDRPNRHDPLDYVEAVDCWDFVPMDNGTSKLEWKQDKESQDYIKLLEESNRLESLWYEEDTQKLRELVSLRHLLWT